MNYDKLIVAGNLGADPSLHEVNDKKVCNFSLAVNRADDETVWYRVSAWGELGENCKKYLVKGQEALVEGRLRADKDTGGPRVFNKRDGETGAAFELDATNVQFGHKPTGTGAPATDK